MIGRALLDSWLRLRSRVVRALLLSGALLLVLQVVISPPPPSPRPTSSLPVRPLGGGAQLAGSTFALSPYTDGEFWGGGSPVERCLACTVSQVANAPQGQSTKPGQNVDPDTGNFSSSYTLFSDPSVGGNLGVTLTYNSGLAQTESSSSLSWFGTSLFGYGWESNDFPTVSSTTNNGTTTVTVNEENGAQVTFTAESSTSASCDDGTANASQFTDNNLITSTTAYCAPARVDSQLGLYNSHYYFTENSDRRVVVFDPYQFPAGVYSEDGSGPDTFNGVDGQQYFNDVAPGSKISGTNTILCPSNTAYACNAIEDAANTVNPSVPARVTAFQMTSAGNVYNIVDPSGANYPLVEDTSRGNLTEISTPHGSWSFGYDSVEPSPFSHDLSSIEDPNLHTTSIAYNYASSSGQVTSVTDAAGNETIYSYANTACTPCGNGQAPNEQRTTVSYPYGETDVDYYTMGLLTASSFGSATPNSATYDTVAYNYDLPSTSNPTAANVLTLVEQADAGGGKVRSMSIATNDVGDVLSVTDWNGNTTTNSYDTSNHFDDACWSAGPGVPIPSGTSCANAPPGSTSFTYDANGNETSVTDPLGNTTHYGYNPVWITSNGSPVNLITDQLCWAAPPSVTVASGASCSSPPAGSTAYTYDQYGNLTSKAVAVGTPQAETQTATYDASDRMLSSIPPDGNVSGANPANYQTTYSYYPVTGNGANDGRLESVTAPGGRVTSFAYDADGNVLSEADPAGVTSGAYDALDRNCWTYRGSSAVSAACGSPPTGASVTSYFASTTAVQQATDPDGNATTYSYGDPRFPTSPTQVTDAMNVATTYDVYDPEGNLCVSGPVSESGCGGFSGDTYNVFDGFGNVTETVDPSGMTTYLAYTDAAYPRLLTEVWGSTSPTLPSTADYSYDADGHRVLAVDAAGNQVSTAYTADGQKCWQAPGLVAPSCQAPPSGTGVSLFSYYPNGLESQMTDNPGTVQQAVSSYTYDASGNTLSKTDDNGKTVSYQYDAPGDLTCIAYPVAAGSTCTQAPSSTNTVVDRSPDSAGRLASTADWLGNTVSYGYDPRNDVTGITYTSGSTTVESVTYGYDAAQNLTQASFSGSVPGTSTETWTPNKDELVGSTTQLAGYSSSFAYNQYDQVTKATNPGVSGADSFSYANDGLLQQDTPPGASANVYSYNGAGELTTLTDPSTNSTATYAYTTDGQRCWSASGNIASPSCSSTPTGATSYAWNGYGQVCWSGPATSNAACGSPPSGSTSYAYDGSGLRMTETPPSGPALAFTWATVPGLPTPALLSDGTNAYVEGPSMFGSSAPIEQIALSSSQVSFLMAVPSGIQLAFSSTGALLDRSSYSTYGMQSNSAQQASPFGFAGGYTDPSGLQYLINRYYDPTTGQFLSMDPLVEQTSQPYEYARDNPINFDDPSGLHIDCGPNNQDCQGLNVCQYSGECGPNPAPAYTNEPAPGTKASPPPPQPNPGPSPPPTPAPTPTPSQNQQAVQDYTCGTSGTCASPQQNAVSTYLATMTEGAPSPVALEAVANDVSNFGEVVTCTEGGIVGSEGADEAYIGIGVWRFVRRLGITAEQATKAANAGGFALGCKDLWPF